MTVLQLRDENVVQTLNRAASGLLNQEPQLNRLHDVF